MLIYLREERIIIPDTYSARYVQFILTYSARYLQCILTYSARYVQTIHTALHAFSRNKACWNHICCIPGTSVSHQSFSLNCRQHICFFSLKPNTFMAQGSNADLKKMCQILFICWSVDENIFWLQTGFNALSPFVPVKLDNYSNKEVNNVLDYLTEMNWIQVHKYRTSQKARRELMFLSNNNPFYLDRILRTCWSCAVSMCWSEDAGTLDGLTLVLFLLPVPMLIFVCVNDILNLTWCLGSSLPLDYL